MPSRVLARALTVALCVTALGAAPVQAAVAPPVEIGDVAAEGLVAPDASGLLVRVDRDPRGRGPRSCGPHDGGIGEERRIDLSELRYPPGAQERLELVET